MLQQSTRNAPATPQGSSPVSGRPAGALPAFPRYTHAETICGSYNLRPKVAKSCLVCHYSTHFLHVGT